MEAFKLAIILVLLAACVANASIEKEPLKVTHRNSGPRYDIEDVERIRSSDSQDNDNQVVPSRRFPPSEEPSRGAPSDAADQPEGHITIRRIFLVPVMRSPMPFGEQPQQPSIWTRGSNDQPGDLMSALFPGRVPNLMSSFMPGPMIPHQSSPADLPAASEERPTGSAPVAGGEREDLAPLRPLIDPLQMLLDMMAQAVNAQSTLNQQPGGDLNKEASGQPQDNKPAGDEINKSSTELERPQKSPASQNETREEVVEIEGKKFLRKTVINRHIGENIIFMTKRLIFTPLNETDAGNTTPSSTTAAPTTENAQPISVSSTSQPIDSTPTTEIPKRPEVESGSDVSSETPITTSASSSTTSPETPSDAPEVAASQPETEATTPKDSLIERVSEAVERAAERLVESSGTTAKPNESS